jgi:hypothetical protein
MSNHDSEAKSEEIKNALVPVTVELLPRFYRWYKETAEKHGQTIEQVVAQEVQRHELQTLEDVTGLDAIGWQYEGLYDEARRFLDEYDQRNEAERHKKTEQVAAGSESNSQKCKTGRKITAEAGVECVYFELYIPQSLVKVLDGLGIGIDDFLQVDILESLKADLEGEYEGPVSVLSPRMRDAHRELTEMIDEYKKNKPASFLGKGSEST